MDNARSGMHNLPLLLVKKFRKALNELRKDAIHLFLLSPPLSGSTVIMQLIKTSPQVTVLPNDGEGQQLPELGDMLWTADRWNSELIVDWSFVRETYNQYWSPLKPIRFEKSPPNIIRAHEMEQIFPNAHFLLNIRNPYAQIEGLIRRGWVNIVGREKLSQGLPEAAKSAAQFWVRTARYQLHNMERLQKSCPFSYEELTDTPEKTIQKILGFLPQLESLDSMSTFTAHNVTGKPISGLRNLNQQKIDRLTPTQIDQINSVLMKNLGVLEHFHYSLL